MLLLIDIVKTLTEIVLMVIVGRGMIGLLARQGKERNPFWQLFNILCQPALKFTRFLSPRIVLDRHIPLAAFALLTGVWLIVLSIKVDYCSEPQHRASCGLGERSTAAR